MAAPLHGHSSTHPCPGLERPGLSSLLSWDSYGRCLSRRAGLSCQGKPWLDGGRLHLTSYGSQRCLVGFPLPGAGLRATSRGLRAAGPGWLLLPSLCTHPDEIKLAFVAECLQRALHLLQPLQGI